MTDKIRKVGKAALNQAAETPKDLKVVQAKGKTRKRISAEINLSPCAANAYTAKTFAVDFMGELHIVDAIAVLQEKVVKVQTGNFTEVEATLAAQAVALDAIFNGLAKRAAVNMGQHIGACETYLRLALKAQAQCRATLETLAEIKYPKHPTFVGQQNVALQQQVNNANTGQQG